MPLNSFSTRRPDSTFATYVPENASQQQAKETVMLLTDHLLSVIAPFNQAGQKPQFDAGMMLVLAGGVGTGKSHLMEAMANRLEEAASPAERFTFLSKGKFDDFGISSSTYDSKPLLLIDDLFSNFGSVAEIDTYSMQNFMRLVTVAYDHQRTVVVTTNFPITQDILPVFKELDPQGRAFSRAHELIHANSAELVIEGGDYRLKLAEKKGGLLSRLKAAPSA